MHDDDYAALAAALAHALPAERIVADPLRRLAYGTDASFYRLIPRLVVFVQNEEEVRRVLAECRARKLPLIEISAVRGDGLNELLEAAWREIARAREAATSDSRTEPPYSESIDLLTPSRARRDT